MILMLVEGESDEKALPILVHKIAGGSVPLKVRNLRGKGNLLNAGKVESHIRLAYRTDSSISKVLLCIDSECTPVETTRNACKDIEATLRSSFPRLQLKYVIVDHSLEGWLLTDRKAVQGLLGPKGHVPTYSNPEDNCRPAELLEDCFNRNDKAYLKTRDASKLADLLDTNIVAGSSKTFKEFCEVVTGQY